MNWVSYLILVPEMEYTTLPEVMVKLEERWRSSNSMPNGYGHESELIPELEVPIKA